MKIKWYGHASFRITAANGITIITDPYTPETSGYKAFTESADIVIISSDNDSYHCRADLIPGSPTIINALELAQSGQSCTEYGVTFTAIKAMEALDHHEHDPDQNGMYRFEVDGISIGHMGDVGNALTTAQIEFFNNVDILLALAGGHPTIALDDLKILLDHTQPRLIIPMHFRTLRYKQRNTLWIQSFLDYFDVADVEFACDSEVELTPESLDEYTVLVMDYA